MTRRRRWARALTVGALGIGLYASASASAVETPYPNFPPLRGFGYLAGGTTTSSFVEPSKQWIRMTDALVVADAATAAISTTSPPGNVAYCHSVFPTQPERCVLPPGAIYINPYTAYVYPLNLTDPVIESTVGRFPDIHVRTVAFGAVPVEATIEATLPTGADGNPIPLVAETDSERYEPGTGPYADETRGSSERYNVVQTSPITGELELRLSRLSVDGKVVDVGDRCAPVALAVLDGVGEGYVREFVDPDEWDPVTGVPKGRYNAALGGVIRATLTVPGFANCQSGAEDLSALITVMASGAHETEIVQAEMTGWCWNLDPAKIDLSLCEYPGAGEFPDGETLPPLPPDYLPD